MCNILIIVIHSDRLLFHCLLVAVLDGGVSVHDVRLIGAGKLTLV